MECICCTPYVFTFKMKGVTDINRQPLKFIGKEHQSTVEWIEGGWGEVAVWQRMPVEQKTG